MTSRDLTESERWLIAMALRAKADGDRAMAKLAVEPPAANAIAAALLEQAKLAQHLAELFEAADTARISTGDA